MSEIEYYLWIHNDMIGKELEFEAFPELKGTYIEFRNSLCPSQYDSSIVCFWEGDLEAKLLLNGKEISVNDHDYKRTKFSIVDNYIIRGLGPIVINRSKDETYLKFSIREV